MVLSKRERRILIATVVAAGMLILSYTVNKYLDARAGRQDDLEATRKKIQLARDTIDRRDRIAPRWRQMVEVGAKSDPAEAKSQILHAMHDWAEQAGVSLPRQKPEPSAEKTRLPEIKFREDDGKGDMKGLAGLLWRMQTASIPIRITELIIDSHKEGAADLTFTLGFSTVYSPPKRDDSAAGEAHKTSGAP